MLGHIDMFQRTTSQLLGMAFPPPSSRQQLSVSRSLYSTTMETCTLCWERQDTRSPLPCQHGFCSPCLKRLPTLSVPSLESGDQKTVDVIICCPACPPPTPTNSSSATPSTDEDSSSSSSSSATLSEDSSDSLLSAIMGVVDLREEEEAAELELFRSRQQSSDSGGSFDTFSKASFDGMPPPSIVPPGLVRRRSYGGSSGSSSSSSSSSNSNTSTKFSTAPTSPNSSCGSCDDGGLASSRCRECDEVLCDNCVRAHRRVRLTKSHSIVRVDCYSMVVAATSAPASATSSPTGTTANKGVVQLLGNNGRPRSPCDLHPQQAVTVFCDTCREPACGTCVANSHREHDVIYLNDAVAGARCDLQQILEEARECCTLTEAALEEMRRLAVRVECSAQSAATKVRASTRNFADALDVRERHLLQIIENIRQVKGNVLRQHVENIGRGFSRARLIAVSAADVLDQPSSGGLADLAMLRAQRKIPDHRKELRSLLALHATPENDHLIFTPPEPVLLETLNNFGHVTSCGYGPASGPVGVMPRQVHRERLSSIVVQVRDHAGANCSSGGEVISATLLGPNSISAGGTEVQDRRDGTYLVSFRSSVDGEHQLSVTLRGLHFQQSPFTVEVRGARDLSRLSVGAAPPVQLQFGREGEADGELCRPWGVCCDRQGNIVVADRSNNRVQIFTSEGRFVRKFGSSGIRNGQFDRPAGVTVDGRGHIVVADKDNHRVQVFTAEGAFLHKFGEKGSRPGQFNYPWDVAADSQGRIVVSDTRNHRIQLFGADGGYLAKYGFEGGVSWKQFDSPRGVAFAADGHVVVTDFNNHRIVVVDPELRHARFLCGEGSAPGQFLRPQGIAVDHEGHMVVADSRNHRVQVFKPDGGFLFAFGKMGGGSGQMDRPSGVCVGPDGRIVVVDFGNNRILVF